MNKYIVLSAVALVISLGIGCQNCGYKTAHCSRYQSLVGTTRLASPQTNCRYNTCNVCSSPCNPCNPCNTCNTCNTQVLANNGQFCSNPYAQTAYPTGYYQPYAGENASAKVSLLDESQQLASPGETPLRWRSVTEEEQRYANSSVNPASVGIASALGNPAFGSPAPASVVDPQYNNAASAGVAEALSRRPGPGAAPQYPGRYPNSSPRAAMGVASALDVPNHPLPRQYPNQYNSSPRAATGVASALTPGRPSPGYAPQYSGQYPNQYPDMNGYSYGQSPASGSDQMRWRRVTEEEQQYPNSSRMSAPGASYNRTPGYGSSNPSYPNAQYGDSGMQEPLAVPVYPENNVDSTQTQGNSSTPEIDPNALPMPEPPTSTF